MLRLYGRFAVPPLFAGLGPAPGEEFVCDEEVTLEVQLTGECLLRYLEVRRLKMQLFENANDLL